MDLAKLIEDERAARDEAKRMGRSPAFPIYKYGPVIAVGTINPAGYEDCTDIGLELAASLAQSNSRLDSLLHIVARRVADDRDTPVCGFKNGEEVPIDDVRRIIVNGYGG